MAHKLIAARQVDIQGDALFLSANISGDISETSEGALGATGNVHFGYKSLNAIVNSGGLGTFNTAYGTQSGTGTLGGLRNSFYGYQSGFAAVTANDSAFFGYKAGALNISATGNCFFGSGAGQANTTGTNQSLFGFQAGKAITTGIRISIFGSGSGGSITSSNDCAIFGALSGPLITGSGNLLLGGGIAPIATTAAGNTIIGDLASNLTTAASNLIISSGNTMSVALTTGVANVLIYGGSVAPTTGNNCILIGHAGVAADTGFIRIGTAGTQTKNFQAGIAGVTTDVAAVACLVSSTGQLGVTSSNELKKKEFEKLDDLEVQELLQQIPVRKFKYIQGHQSVNIGPNIEDLEAYKHFHEDLIARDEEGKAWAFATQNLPWLLVHEVQRLNREVCELKKEEVKFKPNYALKCEEERKKRQLEEDEDEEEEVRPKSKRQRLSKSAK